MYIPYLRLHSKEKILPHHWIWTWRAAMFSSFQLHPSVWNHIILGHDWDLESRKNRKVQIDKIDFNRRNLTQPWHASDNHTDPYQVSPLWLGLKVTDKPGIEYNAECSHCSCYGQCYLTPGRDLIAHYLDMTRGKLSGDIVDLRYLNTIQSNIHEQWRALSRQWSTTSLYCALMFLHSY